MPAVKRERSPGRDGDAEDGRPAKRGRKVRYVIAPHAPEGHKIAIRNRLRKKKALKRRMIPSAWGPRSAVRLTALIGALRRAAEEGEAVGPADLKQLWEVYAALDNSKPTDLSGVQEELRTVADLLGHPTWILSPELVPEATAHAFAKLFDAVARAHIVLPPAYLTDRLKAIAFQMQALQLATPRRYEAALGAMTAMVGGWDRKAHRVTLDPTVLLRVCETAARPPFGRALERSRPEVVAAAGFLQAIERCGAATCLSPAQRQQVRAWRTAVEAEGAKFDADPKGPRLPRPKPRGLALYRTAKVVMKPIKPRRPPRKLRIGQRVIHVRRCPKSGTPAADASPPGANSAARTPKASKKTGKVAQPRKAKAKAKGTDSG